MLAKKFSLSPIAPTTLTVTFETWNYSILYCHHTSLEVETDYIFRTVLKVTLWFNGIFCHSFSHLPADFCKILQILASACICFRYLHRILALFQKSNLKHKEQNASKNQSITDFIEFYAFKILPLFRQIT